MRTCRRIPKSNDLHPFVGMKDGVTVTIAGDIGAIGTKKLGRGLGAAPAKGAADQEAGEDWFHAPESLTFKLNNPLTRASLPFGSAANRRRGHDFAGFRSRPRGNCVILAAFAMNSPQLPAG
jgi:hypothetical protein